MVHRARALMAVVVPLLLLAPAPAAQAQVAAESAVPAPLLRADTSLSVKNREGAVLALQVEMRQWSLVAGRDVPRFPADGDLLVQLRAGRVATVVDGQSTERSEGEFWLVPAGKTMSVRVTTEMATLQTVRVTRR